MQQAFTIPNTNFPGLNEIIKVAKAHPMAYSSRRRSWKARSRELTRCGHTYQRPSRSGMCSVTHAKPWWRP